MSTERTDDDLQPRDTRWFEARYDEALAAFDEHPTGLNAKRLDTAKAAMFRARDREVAEGTATAQNAPAPVSAQ